MNGLFFLWMVLLRPQHLLAHGCTISEHLPVLCIQFSGLWLLKNPWPTRHKHQFSSLHWWELVTCSQKDVVGAGKCSLCLGNNSPVCNKCTNYRILCNCLLVYNSPVGGVLVSVRCVFSSSVLFILL